MNQDKFIKSFKEFAAKCYKSDFNTDESIKLFGIWYGNESQKWINIRNFESGHFPYGLE